MQLSVDEVVNIEASEHLEPGDLVFFAVAADGLVARPRWIVPCAAGAHCELEGVPPQARLHVCWYPRVREADGRWLQVWGGHAPVQRQGHDTRVPVCLWPPCVEPNAARRLPRNHALVLTLTPPLSLPRAPHPLPAALDEYLHRSASAVAQRRPPEGAQPWIGSYFETYAGHLPIAAYAWRATQQAELIPLEVLERWVDLAVRRLRCDPETESVAVLAELLGEVATLRALALAYRVDADADGEVMDTWTPPTDFPDLAHAAYDCEDAAYDALAVLAALQHAGPVQGRALTQRLAHLAREYAFCFTLGTLRTAEGPTWHAYVTGWDRQALRAALGLTATPLPRSELPPLLIEGTEYTSSCWSTVGPNPAAVFDRHAFPQLLGNAAPSGALKIPGALVRESPQYVSTALLFVPPDLQDEVGGAEVLLARDDESYGIATRELMEHGLAPHSAHWRVVGGWTPELRRELPRVLGRLPPPVAARPPASSSAVPDPPLESVSTFVRTADVESLRQRHPQCFAPPAQVFEWPLQEGLSVTEVVQPVATDRAAALTLSPAWRERVGQSRVHRRQLALPRFARSHPQPFVSSTHPPEGPD